MRAEVWTRPPGKDWRLQAVHTTEGGDPREFAEFAIRATLGTMPQSRHHDDPAWQARASVAADGAVLVEVEIGAVLRDAGSQQRIRQATWGEMATSINAPDGVFDVDGRRVFVG